MSLTRCLCLRVQGRTALHVAARNGHDTVVRALLQHSATTNAQNADGFTPLHWAAKFGQVDAMMALIENEDRRADVEARDEVDCIWRDHNSFGT